MNANEQFNFPRLDQASLRVSPPNFEPYQTTFGYGRDHFSISHKNHEFGSTDPLQRDFGLNLPNGRFQPLSGVSSAVGVSIQASLLDFKIK